MRIITIKCFNDGKSELTNMQYHFSGENKASKLVLDFSLVTHKNYHKWLDVLLQNGEYARYYLGQAEIAEKELTNELTIPGYITFAPFITDSEEENARKIKFQQQTVTIRTQLDAGSTTVTPKNDRLFELLKKTEELEENKLDKITKIGNELVDVIELLLSKANQTEILKLVQDIELDVSTGILTIEKYDGEKIVYDLPLEFTVADGYYDEISQEIVIVYTSGAQIRIPVSGLITQVNLRLSNLENEIEKFKDGTTKVKNAEYADKITTKEPKTIERIMVSDITASNDVEILDSQMGVKNAHILKIAGVGVKQVLKNSEAEVLTTDTPIEIRGNTVVEDNVIKNSNPTKIISKSNNLFDKNELVDKRTNIIINETGFTITDNNYVNNIPDFPLSSRLKPNTTYTMSRNIDKYYLNATGRILLVNPISSTTITLVEYGTGTQTLTFTTPSDIALYTTLRIYGLNYDDTAPINFTNVTINEGTTALPYQPYAKHEIALPDLSEYFPNGLGRLPNGVYDEVGVKRIGSVVFTGNENWNIFTYNTPLDNTVVFYTSSTIDIPNLAVDASYVNNLGYIEKTILLEPNYSISDTEGIMLTASSSVKLRIQINKSKLDGYSEALSNTEKVNLFKSWLSDNNLEILYELATPIPTGITLPNVPTYDGGTTIMVDNSQNEDIGEVVKLPKYQVNCEAKPYFVSAKLTDYTNAKVTNGTLEYPLTNGYAKFTPTVTGEYWLEYVKDGVNKVSKAQWIEVYDPTVKTKTADELNAFYSKFYNYGLTPSNVSKLVSSGDNWYKGEYSIVSPNVEYKVIGQDFTITFYDKYKVVISTTQASTFTTPNNCIYVSSNKNDIALYLSSNPTTEYLPYTEDIVEIPAFEGLSLPNGVRNSPEMTRVGSRPYQEGDVSSANMLTDGIITWYELENPIPNEVVWDKQYVAWNYGMEKLDGLAQIVTKYQLDLVSQTVTNTENITDNRKKITSLFEVINSQYKIEIYSSTDFPQVVRKPGVLYGSYDVETKKIDWFFGD